MKICFYTSTLGKGGAERVITNLSNYLVKDNEITIIVNKINLTYKIDKKVKLIELDDKKIINPLTRNIKRMITTFKYLKCNHQDIILGFLPIPSFRLLIIKPFIKSKIIISDRNDPKIEYKNIILKILMKLLYKKADGFVFQTKEQQQYFNKNIIEKSVIIKNPIKDEFLKSNKKIKKEKVIINVGRLEKQKNQIMLINAFSEVYKKHPDYILKIYGDGSLKESLEYEINKLNLSNNVFLCGFTSDIKKEILKSSIFVLSSDYEGLPNSLIEAMACSTSCISTNCPCGGAKELIENNNNGILTKVNDKEEMTKAINYLIENDKIRKNIEKNAGLIKNKLNPKEINKLWKEYILEVVNE